MSWSNKSACLRVGCTDTGIGALVGDLLPMIQARGSVPNWDEEQGPGCYQRKCPTQWNIARSILFYFYFFREKIL